ncbi:MAG TPA: ATP-binding protein [Steroidobacteraceae bacterium]|jgi:hypothetical protein
MSGEDAQDTAQLAQEMRVIVLPPTLADGQAMGKLFSAGRIGFLLVSTVSELCREAHHGVGTVILSEEALIADSAPLVRYVADQQMWSDLPIIVLSRSRNEPLTLAQIMSHLGNVSVIERPVRTSTLLSLVRSNCRARQRQYQVREYLTEREELLRSERWARADAQRESRIKDEFLATLSHELRTPLNAVLGWTQVLRQTAGLPDSVVSALEIIERNARSQSQIIADLLDMSSIISGKVRLDVQRIDLAPVVNATVETLRPTAEAKAIRLQIVLDPTAGAIRGDPNRLQQILWNLLANAVKFTPKDGQVCLTLARTHSHLEIEVTDNGEGIEPAFLPYIFDRFRQADASTTRRHGGLGLGLSIVKQLVELHGGSITVNSAGHGQGATFRVALPLMPAGLDADETDTPPAHPTQSATALPELSTSQHIELKGLTVLVVDDESDARALLQRVLEEHQARVITAASVDEALTALVRNRPDVLVSDIGMPLEDGYSLIRRVRSMGNGVAHIPAIALTAYARAEDRLKAIDAGYQLHLSKPVEPIELASMIESVARGPHGRRWP